nr:MAG: hypothetical protein [Microvirus Sku218]
MAIDEKKQRPISLINVEFNNSFNKTKTIKAKDLDKLKKKLAEADAEQINKIK